MEPRDEERPLDRIEQATEVAGKVDWRLHDLNVVLVREQRR